MTPARVIALAGLASALAGCSSPALLPVTAPAATLVPIRLAVCRGRPPLPATATDCPPRAAPAGAGL